MNESEPIEEGRSWPITLLVTVSLVLGSFAIAHHKTSGQDDSQAPRLGLRSFEPTEEELSLFSDSLLELRRMAAKDEAQLAVALLPAPGDYSSYRLREHHKDIQRLLDDRGLPSLELYCKKLRGAAIKPLL